MNNAPGASAAIPPQTDNPFLDLSHRAKLQILGAVLLGLFLTALDQTIVGTALPRIVTDLGGNTLYTWVVTIYLLCSTVTVPFYGKLSDLYGRRPILMAGITLFLIGSALSGLSQTMWQLILFRGIQGLGAGALFPISLAVIGDLFTPAERGKYQGLFGVVFGLSSVIGPALGGFITDTISWHWVFYVNIPLGLVSLYIIWRLLPATKRQVSVRSLDYLGVTLFVAAIALLLVGLTNKQTAPWSDLTVGGFIALGLLIGSVFIYVESRAKEPIIPLDLWRNRTYSAAIVSVFFISSAFFGAVIFLPRWFQVVRGASATESGYQVLALLIGLLISSVASGQIVSRKGHHKAILLGGVSTAALGMFLMSRIGVDTPLPMLWVWMFITGIGIGPTMSVYTIVVQNAVPYSRLGVATSNLTFFRQIGGSVGLAVIGTLFGTRLQAELPARLAANSVPPQVLDQFGPNAIDRLVGVGVNLQSVILTSVPEQARAALEPMVPGIVRAVHEAFSMAVGGIFLFGVLTALIALAASSLMQELAPRQRPEAAPSQAAPEEAASPGGRT